MRQSDLTTPHVEPFSANEIGKKTVETLVCSLDSKARHSAIAERQKRKILKHPAIKECIDLNSRAVIVAENISNGLVSCQYRSHLKITPAQMFRINDLMRREGFSQEVIESYFTKECRLNRNLIETDDRVYALIGSEVDLFSDEHIDVSISK